MLVAAPSGARSSTEKNKPASPPARKGGGGILACLTVILSLQLTLSQGNISKSMDIFPKVTISALNCNSLNMSSIGNTNHLLKSMALLACGQTSYYYQMLGCAMPRGSLTVQSLIALLEPTLTAHTTCFCNQLATKEVLES
jgi:hypothetical protein